MKKLSSSSWTLISTLLVAVLAFPLGCETEAGEPSTGSESHFLRSCHDDSECGELSCLCGVCSAPCDADAVCTELDAAAECVPSAARPSESACATPPESMCDLRCASDADCESLAAESVCTHGFCRETPGDTDGSGGAGGAPPASEIDADGRIELTEVCSMYQADVCKIRLGCEADPGFCDEAHCQAALGCVGFDALERGVAGGRLAYDPVAAADCHAFIQNEPCSFGYGLIVLGMPGLFTLLNACPGVLEAQQDVGSECYGEEECSFGTHCDHELACPGSCVTDDPPLGDAGDPCMTVLGPEQNCVAPLVCLLPAGTESGEQECGTAPRAGDPCEGASECRCNGPEALCQTLGCDLSLGECVPLSEVGEACSTLDATGVPDCLAPAWCDGGFDGGICRAQSGAGGPCSNYLDCLEPLTCIEAVCVPAVGPGEVCSFGGDCLRGDCVDGICAPLAAIGEACEIDGDCEVGSMCADGACQRFSCPGASCSAAAPCLEGRCVSGSCAPWLRPGDACGSDADCSGGPTSSRLVCAAGVCSEASECW